MAGEKLAGVDVIVKTGTPATAVGGQSGATLNRTLNLIETTDKTSGGWVTKVGGTKEWSVEMEAFMIVGDSAFTALNTAWANREEVDVEMAIGSILFKGKALISDFPIEAPLDDAVTFSITLEGTGALTESAVI
ncbi:TP901-1 family phage major tail protein [Neobacillus niacini]|uniref:phage tail tube protein n=1 Tax=Neobacillus driksii TaxID=3035913 RepID=UPI0027894FE4|nr:phage tail tube protein [Neobacillus niacini]MDQ0976613.1 TP901-1 family phage major tail protein [Neobacillus niacini]